MPTTTHNYYYYYSPYKCVGTGHQWLLVKLNGVDLEIELDTGASISIISEPTYNKLWPQGKAPAIQESQVKMKTYSGEQLPVKGVIKVEVQSSQCEQLQLVVARGNGPNLFGRNWLMKLRLNWTHLCNNHVCYSLSLQGIPDEYSSVFHLIGNSEGYYSDNFLGPYSTVMFLQGPSCAIFTKRKNWKGAGSLSTTGGNWTNHIFRMGSPQSSLCYYFILSLLSSFTLTSTEGLTATCDAAFELS